MYNEEDLRDKYDDDAVFGDIAVQAIMGVVADGIKGLTDSEIEHRLTVTVSIIKDNLDAYIKEHMSDMVRDVKGV